ncbi:unnamed protein product [Phytomonas sp. EM1]|nr:unnamed protein product [Phytomonas sp. EM1]|eukprot:CCW64421.1 unnamed protein product [Phytomonas sp. isolate EM1]
MAQRASIKISKDLIPVKHVSRAIKNSDCRTPIIFIMEDEDPFVSVYAMATQQDSAVWVFDLAQNKSKQNIMDYIDVSVNNGDWVYLQNCNTVDETFFREVTRFIYHLKPEPKRFPRRELFRCFFCVQKAFDPNGPSVKPFPLLLLQISIIARKVSGVPKWTRILPANVNMFSEIQRKRQIRRNQGRDSDSESDIDVEYPISGKIFYRSTELDNDYVSSPLFTEKQIMEKAIREEDLATIREQVTSLKVDLESELCEGMTPLQLACVLERTESVKTLLELNADPNRPRLTDGRPPLFMCIDDVKLAEALVDAGADLFAKFEGFRADSHPDTAPDVAAYLRKERTQVWSKK